MSAQPHKDGGRDACSECVRELETVLVYVYSYRAVPGDMDMLPATIIQPHMRQMYIQYMDQHTLTHSVCTMYILYVCTACIQSTHTFIHAHVLYTAHVHVRHVHDTCTMHS